MPARPQTTAVLVQSARRFQSRTWDFTFLCGMVDGEFPQGEAFNFLQPKKEGLALGRTCTTVDHARNQFYQVVRATVQELHISLPLAHNGRKLSPSPLLKEINFPGPEVQAAGPERQAARPEVQATGPERQDADSASQAVELKEVQQLYSRQEKTRAIAQWVDRDYEKALPLVSEICHEDPAFFSHAIALLRFDGLALNARNFSEFDGMLSAVQNNRVTFRLLEADCSRMVLTPQLLEDYAA
ncbi:MAG TPA: hypothetical protein DD727_05655, partial [Clostridiales bacterium]|nr:hypothetical protein [Clostridiales bacterium]